MARMIPAADRVKKARAIIQKAYKVPVPDGLGRADLSFVAEVKDLLRQARDLIKFIPYSVGASPEIKKEVEEIFKEAERAEQEILHPEKK